MYLHFFPPFFGETFETKGKSDQQKTAVKAASTLFFKKARDWIKPKSRVKQLHKTSKEKHSGNFKKAVQPEQMETQKSSPPPFKSKYSF